MDRMQLVTDRIKFVRGYTLGVLDPVSPEDWFRQPTPGTSHIAWQVGHLSASQYGLALRFIRGEKPHDSAVLPPEYFRLFGPGSTVEADADKYPSAQTLRQVFDRVHNYVVEELASVAEAELDQPALRAHPAFRTKFDCLIFCSEHEMVHAGQIGLLRRLLGYAPIR